MSNRIKIGLDAGHYAGDGRVPKAYVEALGTQDEYTLNYHMYQAAEASLKRAGFTVVDIGKQDKSVVSRAKRAGENGCDAVISLHHNAGGGNGITVFRHSNGILGEESGRLQNALYQYLEKVNRGNRKSPLATAELGVINCCNTKCPSVLIECGFMDNLSDIRRINTPGYAGEIAEAIVSGCMCYFGRTEEKAEQQAVSDATDQNQEEEKRMIAEIWRNRTVKKQFTPFAVRTVINVPVGDVLNVRVAPDVSAPALPTWPVLSNGNLVSAMIQYDNDWMLILIAGKYTGYVNAFYLGERQNIS